MNLKHVVINKELPTYVSALKEEMRQKHYSDFEIRTMDRVWQELIHDSADHPDQEFNEDYRQEFVHRTYAGVMEQRDAMYRITRAMNMLSDYVVFGVIFRQYCTPETSFSEGFFALFEAYLESEKERRRSELALKSLRVRLMRFHDYLIDTGAENFRNVTNEQINNYVLSLARYSTTYVSEVLRMLRRLSDYAYQNKHCERSFAAGIPHVKNLRQQKLPCTFTDDEIQKVLQSIDRSNPIGKRNYAIFLVAARLGLRSSDIMALEFSNIDWDNRSISIVQQKTRHSLTLPLPDDVGWAVIDYLKHGRPVSDVNTVFISHLPPYHRLNTLCNLIPKQLRKAGIKSPINKRTGMHAFRHSLATRMLEKEVPLSVISQTLGHADISSTEIYIRVSLRQLSKCGLEVDW